MMDQKTLEEIKAREQAATPGPWCAYGYHVKTEASIMEDEICETERICDADFILFARTDIPALITEVERLMDLSRQNYCKFVRQQEECDRLLRRAEDAESKNATLEKALALMIDRIHKPRTTEEAKDIFEYWIQEGQKELTHDEALLNQVNREIACWPEWKQKAEKENFSLHESTHECDKSALEQEEKSNG